MSSDDRELIARAQHEPGFFGVVYQKYLKRIYTYVWYRVGRSKELAEDFVQETFLRAYKHLPSFRLSSLSYLSYLTRIAHNIVVSYYRKKKTISLESTPDIPVDTEIPARLEIRLNAKTVQEKLRQLKRVERDVLAMRYTKGFSIRDIAGRLNKSENAVKLILSRARTPLRSKIPPEDAPA